MVKCSQYQDSVLGGDVLSSINYSLAIYEPGTTQNTFCSFASNTPFMSISAGDIINLYEWFGLERESTILRIVNIEHKLTKIGKEVKHHISVYTEEVEDTPKIRLTRKQN
jgi:hypothetical protein